MTRHQITPSDNQRTNKINQTRITSQVTDPAFTGWQCGDAEDGCGGILRFGSCSANNATCLNHRGHLCGGALETDVHGHDGQPVGSAGGSLPCGRPLRAGSSGTQYAHSPALNAFDGDESSRWISSCHGCKPREAWLSLQFPDPVVVRQEVSTQALGDRALPDLEPGVEVRTMLLLSASLAVTSCLELLQLLLLAICCLAYILFINCRTRLRLRDDPSRAPPPRPTRQPFQPSSQLPCA
eukprot:s8270_g4.t1